MMRRAGMRPRAREGAIPRLTVSFAAGIAAHERAFGGLS